MKMQSSRLKMQSSHVNSSEFTVQAKLKIKSDDNNQNIFVFTSPITRAEILNFFMKKTGDKEEVFVFFVLKNKDILNIKLTLEILEKNCVGNCFIRGFLLDKASFNLEALVKMGKKSFFSKSFLECKVVTNGQSTSVSVKPFMEIENNEVISSHGTSIGQLSPEEVFYLESKGLSKQKAERVILEGFFESLVLKIDSLKEREKVRKLIVNSL